LAAKRRNINDHKGMEGEKEMRKTRAFPKKIGDFKLHEQNRGLFAFYYKPLTFGFAHSIEIETLGHKHDPSLRIVAVKHMSGNSWGRTDDGRPRTIDDPNTLHWLICRTDYFPNMERAIGHLTDKTEIPKGKRKPVLIAPMTDEEVQAWNDSRGLFDLVNPKEPVQVISTTPNRR